MLEKLYPINSLFFYRFLFMATLIIGEAMFCYKLNRKKNFKIKAPIGILGCFVFSFVFPIPTANPFYSMFMFLAMFAFTFLIARWLFDEKWTMLLFSLICGYTSEHVAYELYTALNCFLIAGDYSLGGLYDYDQLLMFVSVLDLVLYIAAFVNVYWLIFLLFARKIIKGESFSGSGKITILLVGIFFIFTNIVLNSLIGYYQTIHFEKIYIGLFSLVNLGCCLFGIMYIFEMYYKNTINKKYMVIQALREAEKKQYDISKKTIDLINIKCHDLRHQIRLLGEEKNIDINTIKNINENIKIYDANIKTTNEAMNVILTEKSLVCSKYGIKLTIAANGDALHFMSDEDIYSLLGNILDNAIEAASKIERDRRYIYFNIKTVGNMVSISCKNPYVGEVTFIDGLPKTIKEDENFHGFGMQSIRLIVNKYDGQFEINTKNNTFLINLLFILKKSN